MVAEPAMLTGDRIGLLFPPRTEDGAWTSDTFGGFSPRAGLGGNIPAVLVPEDSPLAERLGLRPGGAHGILFVDFGALPEQEKSKFRYTVARVAGGAGVSEAAGSDEGAQSTFLLFVATCASLLLGALLAALAWSTFLAGGRTLRLLAELGMSNARRRTFMLRLVILPFASVLIAALTARVSAGVLGRAATGDYGWSWSLPALAAAVALAVVVSTAGRGSWARA
jgi:hypothetical protein